MKAKLIMAALLASLCFAANASADGDWDRDGGWERRQARWRAECSNYCDGTMWYRWCFRRCMRDKREHYSHEQAERYDDGRWW